MQQRFSSLITDQSKADLLRACVARVGELTVGGVDSGDIQSQIWPRGIRHHGDQRLRAADISGDVTADNVGQARIQLRGGGNVGERQGGCHARLQRRRI